MLKPKDKEKILKSRGRRRRTEGRFTDKGTTTRMTAAVSSETLGLDDNGITSLRWGERKSQPVIPHQMKIFLKDGGKIKTFLERQRLQRFHLLKTSLQHCSGGGLRRWREFRHKTCLAYPVWAGESSGSYFPCQVRLVMAACSLGQRGTVRLCPHSQGKRTRQTDSDGVAERWASHSNYGYVCPRHSMSNLMSHPRFTMQAD